MSLTVSLADSPPAMRGLASAVSHTCTSGAHVHPQWRAYDNSLTTVSCTTKPLQVSLYPVAMGLLRN